MCLNTKTIYARNTYFNTSCSPGFMDVACGHCPECRDAKKNEYVLRGWYEYVDCIRKGGFAYLETLTYNQRSLDTRTFEGIAHFSKDDIRQFFNKLYRYCKNVCSFRYQIVSEYGGSYHRPHYHVLFFIFPFQPYLKESFVYIFQKFVRKSWTEFSHYKYNPVTNVNKAIMRPLGFIDKTKTLVSRIIDRLDGIMYVAKYITKDQDYLEVQEQKFQQVVDNLRSYGDLPNYLKDVDDIDEFLKEKRKLMQPFHLESQGYGSLLTQILQDQVDRVKENPVLFDANLGLKEHKIPLYYLRKLFFDLVPSGKFSTVTGKPCMMWIPKGKLGIDFKVSQMHKRIDKNVDNYYALMSAATQYLPPDRSKDFSNKIYELLDGRTIRDFVIYKTIYQGHFHNNYAFKSDASSWVDFYTKSLYPCTDMDNLCYSEDPAERAQARRNVMCNVINDSINPIWRDFDLVDLMFKEVLEEKNKKVTFERERLRKIQSQLKLLKPFT